jgi:hypothetical protein
LVQRLLDEKDGVAVFTKSRAEAELVASAIEAEVKEESSNFQVVLVASRADVRLLGDAVAGGKHRIYVITDEAWEGCRNKRSFSLVVHWDLGEDWQAFCARTACFHSAWKTAYCAALETGCLQTFQV